MFIRNDLVREKQLIEERIKDEDKEFFEALCSYCSTENDWRTLFVHYRHLLNDIHDTNWGTTIYSPLKRPIRIGYMMNTDIVFYGELDYIICNYLRNEGAEIIQFKCEDIYLEASKDGLKMYIKNEPIEFDGFLSYGYRSELKMQAYLTVVKLMEEKGVVCLNSHYDELILNNKMLQGIQFAASKIPVPAAYQAFGIEGARNISLDSAVIKHLSDYGSDGVFKVEQNWVITDTIAKNLWRGQHILIQKIIPDSFGESIRVLCINGEAFAIMKYQDASGDFRSNISFGDRCKCISLMHDKKFEQYKEIAEHAIRSIGNILICGVDLLDSKSEGIVVLEINNWPEISDIWRYTKMCTFKRFAEVFMEKVKSNIKSDNNNNNSSSSSSSSTSNSCERIEISE